MEKLSFENLPAAISTLIREVNSIKLVLQENKPPTTDQIMTVEQAAEFLSLAKPTLYAMIGHGKIPYFKRGKRVYFQKSDILNYLREGRRKSIQELKDEGRGK